MSDVEGIVLHTILRNPDENVLAIWPRLKTQFFNSDYSQIYVAISKYYNKYQQIPSFESLKITTRDQSLVTKLQALELLSVTEDIDIDIAVEALKDQFTQEETLNQLSTFVDKITSYDTQETKQKLGEILQHLDELTDSSEEIFLMNDIVTFDKEEIHSRCMLGLNNQFDSSSGGVPLTQLFMIGGHRGAGKSVVCCNIAINQYDQGNVSLYFSIEMRFREVFNRYLSIMSGIDYSKIELDRCTSYELTEIAKIRKDMFTDSEEVFQDYLRHGNYDKFETSLISSKKLKQNNQLITVDNQSLTLADIDMNVQRFKNKHGDKLKVVIVDYVNQIQIPDIYDWKSQIHLSKKLKDIARKHDVVMVTPYQIDKSGEARFAKGILDAADTSIILENRGEYINFKSTKTRGLKAFDFNAPCMWDCLRILPEDAIILENDKESKESSRDI